MMQNMKSSNVLEKVISKVSQDVVEALANEEGLETWPRFMDTKTTALYLDKSVSCVRNWIREGVIPTVQLSTLKRSNRLPVFVDRYALDRLFAPKN